MIFKKVLNFMETLPMRKTPEGVNIGNSISISGEICGLVAIIKINFEDLSFEIQKEGSHFLILSRYHESILELGEFTNNENIEDELIKLIEKYSNLRGV